MKPSFLFMWASVFFLAQTSAAGILERVLAPLAEEPPPQVVRSISTGTATPDPKPVPADSLTREVLLQLLTRELSSKLMQEGALELVPTRPLPDLTSHTLPVAVELLDFPSRLQNPNILLRFRIRSENTLIGEYAVPFRCRLQSEVWVPLRRLPQGELPQEQDFAIRVVDLLRDSNAVPFRPGGLERYELARSVSPDRPLSWSDLAPRSVIRRGQVVDVFAAEGLLRIQMKGQATEDGAIGDIILVRNLESRREFPAEIIDEKRVRVYF